MKILVSDDHALVRQGLNAILLHLEPGACLLEAEDAQGVMQQVEAEDDLDMILLDLFMPGANGFELLQRVCNRRPDTPVVVLSASNDPTHMRNSLDCGAAGYIPKSASPRVMLSALQLVMAGGIYVPPDMLKKPETDSGGQMADFSVAVTNYPSGLTERQKEVLILLGEGKSNKEIARDLDLSENTVKIHVRDVLKVLGVNNRTKAAMLAHEISIRTGHPASS